MRLIGTKSVNASNKNYVLFFLPSVPSSESAGRVWCLRNGSAGNTSGSNRSLRDHEEAMPGQLTLLAVPHR